MPKFLNIRIPVVLLSIVLLSGCSSNTDTGSVVARLRKEALNDVLSIKPESTEKPEPTEKSKSTEQNSDAGRNDIEGLVVAARGDRIHGNREEAKQFLARAAELDAKDPDTTLEMAIIFYDEGRDELAVQLAKLAIERTTPDNEFVIDRARKIISDIGNQSPDEAGSKRKFFDED